MAPDLVQSTLGSGPNSALQVNLFLHQVTYNAAWRNFDQPSLSADGRTRLKNPPLALDLHYLLTVYATEDCQAEALLGFAVQFLHENPVLARDQIRMALGNLGNVANPPASNPFFNSTNPLFGLVASAGLADQLEMIKITPVAMGREEMAWVWTALKADYRLTFPFQVSVVLIQSQKPAVSPLPVLSRQITVHPNLYPLATLLALSPSSGLSAAVLGEIVTVQGANLSNVTGVTLTNARLGISYFIAVPSANARESSFTFTLPGKAAAATTLPAGVYLLTAQLPSSVSAGNVATNALPLAIAPQILTSPATATAGAAVSITCAPEVFVGQEVALIIGGQAAPPNAPIVAMTGALDFVFPNLDDKGTLPLRLRVDDVESPIIDMTKTPPAFTGPSIKVT